MNQSIQKYVGISIVTLVIVLAATPLLRDVTLSARAQESAPAEMHSADANATTRTITVIGDGKTHVKPNIARINIGVDVLRPSVKEANSANNEVIANVLATLTEQGIEKKDIQTSGFSVYAERYGDPASSEAQETNYRVSNTVNVTVRELAKVSDVLDAVINAGANNIYGVEFNIADYKPVQADARKKAMADARAKAEELAELAGVKLGEIVSVSEAINSGIYFQNFSQAALQQGGGAGPAIQPGELEIAANLQVVFAIAQ